MQKKIMLNNIAVLSSQNCTGCALCYNICPVNAITFGENKEGFLSPRIKDKDCINCGLCASKCPQLNEVKFYNVPHNSFAVIADDSIRNKCSSGGVFGIIASHFLDKGGIVYGASFNHDFTDISHISVHNKADLYKILKSKYVQSNTQDIYKEIKCLLVQGKKILFSGCPCQVDALKTFLSKDYDNLTTIDIICHGVPSPGAYKKFIEEISHKRKLINVDFRDKKYGWGSLLSFQFDNGEIHYEYYNGNYFTAFLSGLSIREACFNCKYAQPNRVGDITIGDFWGVKELSESLDDKKGTSMVLCNTIKGKRIIEELKDLFKKLQKISIKDTLQISNKNNGSLIHPMHYPKMRKCFFYHLSKGDSFSKSLSYAKTSLMDVGIVGWWIETPRSNFGSTLTDYALYKYLLSLGLSVAFISPPNFNRDNAGEFNKRHGYRMTMKYDMEHMRENNKYIDTFIVASDVLWYYPAFINTGYCFLLDFVDKEKKKISYATSFGNTSNFFPNNELLKAQHFLKDFDGVSVREYEAVEICKKRFDVQAIHVLDPVFICNTNEWTYLANLATQKTKKEFLFAYMLDPTEEKAKALQFVAKRLKINLVTITDKQFNPELKAKILKNYGLIKDATIEDLIYHIKNAKFVITDSYHGMCFSIVLRKNFIALINKARGSSRFDTLAQDFNIGNRMIYDINDFYTNESLLSDINYEILSKKIDSEIKRSQQWLNQILLEEKQIKPKAEIDYLYDKIMELEKQIKELSKGIEQI